MGNAYMLGQSGGGSNTSNTGYTFFGTGTGGNSISVQGDTADAVTDALEALNAGAVLVICCVNNIDIVDNGLISGYRPASGLPVATYFAPSTGSVSIGMPQSYTFSASGATLVVNTAGGTSPAPKVFINGAPYSVTVIPAGGVG